MYTAIFVIVCLGLQGVLGYPGGAPSSACVFLLPKHGYPPFEAQISPSPFKLVLSSATYSPSQEMEVPNTLLNSKVTSKKRKKTVAIVSEASPFNGWLLQVRRVDNDMIVGQFIASPKGSRIVSCNGQNNSITHSNSHMFPNTTLRNKWIAPQEDVGNLILTGTVLKDYSTFWGPLESNEIPFLPAARSQDTTTQRPITTSTATTTASTSTSSPTTTSRPTTTLSPTTSTQATTTTIPPPTTTQPTTTTPQSTTTSTTTPQPTTRSSTTKPPTTTSTTTVKPTTKLPSTTTTPSPTTTKKAPIQRMISTTKEPLQEPSSTLTPEKSTGSQDSSSSETQEKTIPSTATKDVSSDTSGNGSGSSTSQNLLLFLSLLALYRCN
ncbi:hypothetical protein LOTGIDRAFT_237152 [Lottia gigantea]|uniref:Reelin domain-containing protein n=1 Tax=Lottia gigantea TaxID=225164 RepID=V4B1G9_LOTGI|nr:hypothetical protein LOTGIDRAFT_237152 [Lottia gigantea]ESO82064.1 hypothetical protein LOTGIDRAFT_237152 [Lottia gigantea]